MMWATQQSSASAAGDGGGNSPFAAPTLSLPKGGGAIRGIGEKFAVSSVTGTGTLTVPIALSPARSGFTPELSLSYDSGSGNGPFGLGWMLTLPAIARKTDKGLPRYGDQVESDVFILSGAEDLVPALHAGSDGSLRVEEFERDGYRIRHYRPRVEGAFARLERWTQLSSGLTHWRSFSRDNIRTLYGSTPDSRISDPADPTRVFKWLIAGSDDGKGNAIRYVYAAEDDSGLDPADAGEHCRACGANRYLKYVRYGNRSPFDRVHAHGPETGWLFEVIFDYGEESYQPGQPNDDGDVFVVYDGSAPARPWPARPDSFSNWRSGFEVRTRRLCQRTLLIHHFESELGTPHCLVKSTEFEYQPRRNGTLLTRAVQSGYRLASHSRYLKRSLPPLEFGYASSPLDQGELPPFTLVDAASLNLPEGVDGQRYRWVDLHGEGLPGVLTEQGGTWFYKHNLGGGRFGPMQAVQARPSIGSLQNDHQQLFDVRGHGLPNLVQLSGVSGFYERNAPVLVGSEDPREAQEGWGLFRSFQWQPVLNWNDPNLRFVDLTGDGLADVLITGDSALRWHQSLAEFGFGEEVRIPSPGDERQGPRVVFADGTQSIYLADMSGDGLSDIVRIRNGEVCYWPNEGYGRFGERITMGGSPWLDSPDQFDQRRIRLADIDGSGTTDLLYLGPDGIRVFLNQSGNSWSPGRHLRELPVAPPETIAVLDFLGRGTACIVWSSPLSADAGRPLRYVDLMCGEKPHLLTTTCNNLGAETRIEYASSTEFYLADAAAGTPWVTRLPFPVHVVKRTETRDSVSRNRLVTTSTYHHGYFDPQEREFRGFGRVDQLDAEEIGALGKRDTCFAADNEDPAWNCPPVLTRTWYHTGIFFQGESVSRHMAHEYYREPGADDTDLLSDSVVPSVSAQEMREASRALKGSCLRREVYALDGSVEATRPYSVAEGNFCVRQLQARGDNRHGVFRTSSRESLTFHYERKLYRSGGREHADPRVEHTVVLSTDDFGNTLESVSVGYGRRFPERSPLLRPEDHQKQSRTLLTLNVNRYTNPVGTPGAYRVPSLAETRTFEMLHVESRGVARFTFDEIRAAAGAASDGLHEIPFEDTAGLSATQSVPYRRLLKHARHFYRSDDLQRILPLARIESLALPAQNYSLVLTAGLIDEVFRRTHEGRAEQLLSSTDPRLERDYGYVNLEGNGNWWSPSGRIFYSPGSGDGAQAELAHARSHFFLPCRYRDPFGNVTAVSYDRHDLTLAETRDALGNTVRAQTDYRTLKPHRIVDANGNRSEAAYDALGMLCGTALMGKESERLGDSLEGFRADLPEYLVLRHLQDPLRDPHEVLSNATTRVLYDLFAFKRSRHESQRAPAVTYALARETHSSDRSAVHPTPVQHSLTYSDGFGREIQKKTQAEPEPGSPATARWIGSGWTVFNNKGKPVRQYEPFFSATPHFEFAVTVGVASTTLYDPTGRTVGVLHPDHSYDKIVLDPWKRESWDVNDTVLENPQQDREIGPFIAHILESEYLPTWYEQRRDGQRGTDEREAALNTAAHARTPTQAFTDGLGRTFLSVAHNRRLHEGERKDEYYSTRTILDVQGNQRAIIDALDRTLVAYDYDLSGNPIHQINADSGHAWALNDVAGGAVLSFDSRGHGLRRTYDALRRPAELFVRTGAGAERLAERIIYGETVPDAATRNLRGKAFKSYDAAGVVTSEEYDFKGNLLSSSRQLLANYRDEVDWAGSPGFEETVFAGRTAYDALSRPTILTAPDESAIAIRYSPANLLERLDVKQAGASRFKEYVSHVRHNARGQREFVRYGNGAQTASSFDPETFRLSRLVTTRRGGSERLQDLGFTYDPVGNFTSIADDAQATVYFKNQAVSARGDYRYDATYQLVEAQGREHAGSSAPDWNDAGVLHLPLPGDGQAMRRYRESYQLDAVGNLLAMVHSAAHCNWTRHYTYADLESRNRLTSTRVGEAVERYEYDVQGNTTRMPHLPSLRWNFKDQLVSSQARSVIHAAAETTYYVYDSAGQRVRKVTESQLGQRRSERIYLGGFERYREYGKESVTLERTTLHVMDGPRRLALLECSAGDCTVRYQFDDQIGSARLELDEAGGIISYEEYYPYGSTSYQAGRSVAEVSLKRYRFTGKERDEETGFSYHGARYYAPWLGRWTSCDPSGLKGGPNLFAYVRGNPITRSDPSGNWDISWTDVAIGAGAAILVVGAVALTAGLAAPAIAGGLAAAGVSAETISAVGTVAVAVGATAGVAGTAETATEVATGVNPVTHQRISDQQRSRQLGALPVQIVASALGLRGIAGGGSSGGSSFGELLPALESGLAEESTFGRFFAPNTSGGTAAVPIAVTPTATGALTGTVVTPIIVNAMSSGGGGGGGGGGNDGEKSSSGSAPEPAAGGESSGEATTGSSSSGEDVGARIRGLPEESQDKLLSRVVRGDAKGRAFGTPRNPRLPTVEEFNPRLENVRAGEVEELVTGTKHGINPDQASSISGLSNEDLVRFRIDDPISGARSDSGLSLTGGHHRVAEIISRVTGGTLDPDTIVQFLVHD